MASATKSKEWTEEKVIDLLRARYKGQAWAFLPHVRNGTGYSGKIQTADAIAMSLWPSRGLDLYGFEVKVSRGDWLVELRNPEKAEDIFGFMDYWYVVAPAETVKRDELPKTWGLLEIQGNQLRETIPAPKLTPKPVNSLFLASLLRKVSENMSSEAELERARSRGFQEGIEHGKADAARQVEYAEQKQRKAEERVETFEKVTGLHFSTWTPTEDVALAVKAVLNGEDKGILRRLGSLRMDISALLDICDKIIGRKEQQSA